MSSNNVEDLRAQLVEIERAVADAAVPARVHGITENKLWQEWLQCEHPDNAGAARCEHGIAYEHHEPIYVQAAEAFYTAVDALIEAREKAELAARSVRVSRKENEKLHTKKEASAVLRCSAVSIHRQIKKGALGCYHVGGRVFIGQSHLDEYLKQCERPTLEQ